MATGIHEQHRLSLRKKLVDALVQMVPTKQQDMIKVADQMENKAFNMAADVNQYQQIIMQQLENFRAKLRQRQVQLHAPANVNDHVNRMQQQGQAFPSGANQAHVQPNPHMPMQQQAHPQLRYAQYQAPMAAPVPQPNQDADFSSFLSDVGLLGRGNDDKTQAQPQQHENALQSQATQAYNRNQGPMMMQQQPGVMAGQGPGPNTASMYLPGLQQRAGGVQTPGLMGLQQPQPVPYPMATPSLPTAVRMPPNANPAAQASQLNAHHQLLNAGLPGVHQPGMPNSQQQQQPQSQMSALVAQTALAQQQPPGVAALHAAAKMMPINNAMQGAFAQAGSQVPNMHMQQQQQQPHSQQPGQAAAAAAVAVAAAGGQQGRVGQPMQQVVANLTPGGMVPLTAVAPTGMAAPRPQHPMPMSNPNTQQTPSNMTGTTVANQNQPGMPPANGTAPANHIPGNNKSAEVRERLMLKFESMIQRGERGLPETTRLVNQHLELSRRQQQNQPGNTRIQTTLQRLEHAKTILNTFQKLSSDFREGNLQLNRDEFLLLGRLVNNVESMAKQLSKATQPQQHTPAQAEPTRPQTSNFVGQPGQAPTPTTQDNQEKGEVIDLTDRHEPNAMHAPTPNSLPPNANSPAVLAVPSPLAASPMPTSQGTAPRPLPRPHSTLDPHLGTNTANNFPLPPKTNSMSLATAASGQQASTPATEAAPTAAQADTGGTTAAAAANTTAAVAAAAAAAAVTTPATPAEPHAPILAPMQVLQQQLEAISSGQTPNPDTVRGQQYVKTAMQQSCLVPLPPAAISSQLNLDQFASPRLDSCNLATFKVENMTYQEEPSQEAGEMMSREVESSVKAELSEQVKTGMKHVRATIEAECSSAQGALPEGAKLLVCSPKYSDVPCSPSTAAVIEVDAGQAQDKAEETEDERSWKRLKLLVPRDYPEAGPQAMLPSTVSATSSAWYQATIKSFEAGLEEQSVPSLKIQDMASIWLDSVSNTRPQFAVAT